MNANDQLECLPFHTVVGASLPTNKNVNRCADRTNKRLLLLSRTMNVYERVTTERNEWCRDAK